MQTALVLTVLTLVGAASAQSVAPVQGDATVTLEFPEPPAIEPGETRSIPVTVIYEYGGQGSTTGEVDVDFWVESESPASASISPSPLTIQVDDSEQRGEGTATLEVTMSEDAAAFDTPSVEVDAKAQRSGTVEASERVETETRPEVAYVADLRLSLGKEEVTVRPGSIANVPITLRNLGNGDARFEFVEVESPDGIGVTPPSPQSVSYQEGSNQLETTLRVFEGGQGPTDGDVRLKARYGPPLTGSPDHETNVVTLTTVGGEASAPVVPLIGGGLIVVAAVGGAVWWLRFR